MDIKDKVQCQRFRERFSLSELAKKRWIENYSVNELCNLTELAKVTLEQHLRFIRRLDSLDDLELSSTEKKIIEEKRSNH